MAEIPGSPPVVTIIDEYTMLIEINLGSVPVDPNVPHPLPKNYPPIPREWRGLLPESETELDSTM